MPPPLESEAARLLREFWKAAEEATRLGSEDLKVLRDMRVRAEEAARQVRHANTLAATNPTEAARLLAEAERNLGESRNWAERWMARTETARLHVQGVEEQVQATRQIVVPPTAPAIVPHPGPRIYDIYNEGVMVGSSLTRNEAETMARRIGKPGSPAYVMHEKGTLPHYVFPPETPAVVAPGVQSRLISELSGAERTGFSDQRSGTLAHWRERYGINVQAGTGTAADTMFVYQGELLVPAAERGTATPGPQSWDLYHLEDYRVSSTSGGSVILVPISRVSPVAPPRPRPLMGPPAPPVPAAPAPSTVYELRDLGWVRNEAGRWEKPGFLAEFTYEGAIRAESLGMVGYPRVPIVGPRERYQVQAVEQGRYTPIGSHTTAMDAVAHASGEAQGVRPYAQTRVVDTATGNVVWTLPAGLAPVESVRIGTGPGGIEWVSYRQGRSAAEWQAEIERMRVDLAERTGHIGEANIAKLAKRRTSVELRQIAASNPNTLEGRAALEELSRRAVVPSDIAGRPWKVGDIATYYGGERITVIGYQPHGMATDVVVRFPDGRTLAISEAHMERVPMAPK